MMKPAPPASSSSQRGRLRGPGLGALAVFALLAADQATKTWVRRSIPVGQITELVPHFFDLTHAPNKGVAFSTFADLPASLRVPLLLVVPAIATLVLVGYLVLRAPRASLALRAGLVLILGGALGNLLDRAMYGEVTDFIRFRFFERALFVNNLADDCISIGGVLFVVASLRESRSADAARTTTAPTPPRSRSSR